jgi:hypothetical protein
MKKFLALILTLALAFSLSTVVFAEERGDGIGKEGKDVTLKVTESGTVYKIDLSWGSLNFVYNLHAGTWSTTDHTYSGGAAGWQVDTANGQKEVLDGSSNCIGVSSTITAVNHSNKAVTVEAAYADAVGYEQNGNAVPKLTGTRTYNLEDASEHINDWTSGTPTACTCEFTFQVTGTPVTATENAVTVGTITITISDT